MSIDSRDVVTIVSGLPRSGTSMMMKMLEAGGLDLLIDHIRGADDDNPNGYYEFEPVKQTKSAPDWLDRARGKAVKMVSALLRDLPPGHRYKVIFMRRRMQEILASQRQMLVRQGKPTDTTGDDQMAALFDKHLTQMKTWLAQQPHIDVVYVDYNRLLENPAEWIESISALLGGRLDTDAMGAVVNPDLYRQRA